MTVGLELFAAALVASVIGSMVGLGGGFILVPLLRLAFGFGPAEAAGTSLLLVVANSGSGAFTYFLQKRVDVKLGLLFGAGGLPGSIIGALLTKHIAPHIFDWLFAGFATIVAIDMIFNAKRRVEGRHEVVGAKKAMSYRATLGIGFFLGIVSSLFGIGGGVIVVPSLLYFSTLPAHAIAATSHFAIVLTSPVGLITHAMQNDVRLNDVLPLVAGGLIGGPIGAELSSRIKSSHLIVVVGIALICVAGSMGLRHFLH